MCVCVCAALLLLQAMQNKHDRHQYFDLKKNIYIKVVKLSMSFNTDSYNLTRISSLTQKFNNSLIFFFMNSLSNSDYTKDWLFSLKNNLFCLYPSSFMVTGGLICQKITVNSSRIKMSFSAFKHNKIALNFMRSSSMALMFVVHPSSFQERGHQRLNSLNEPPTNWKLCVVSHKVIQRLFFVKMMFIFYWRSWWHYISAKELVHSGRAKRSDAD